VAQVAGQAQGGDGGISLDGAGPGNPFAGTNPYGRVAPKNAQTTNGQPGPLQFLADAAGAAGTLFAGGAGGVVAAAGAAAASPGSFFAGVFQGLVGGLAPPQAAATQQLGTFMITPVVPPVCGAMPPVTEKGTGPFNGFLLTANGTLVGKNMSMIFQASVTKEQAKAMVYFNPNPGGRNFFDSFCDFGSAMGDILSGGLTKRFRDAAGYGDRVNTSSAAYGAGQFTGEIVDALLSVVNPCSLAGKMRTLFNLIHVAQGVAGSLNATDSFREGDLIGGGLQLLGAGMNFGQAGRACFTGDMLLDTEHGKKRADAIQVGDKLWSRNEFDPHGPIELKAVEEVFATVAPIMNVHVAGQIIRTTREHPFYVEGRGWIAAAFLDIGDLLSTRNGRLGRVEGVADGGQVTTVYNWRIAEYHTYFVSARDEGPVVWAHNACSSTSGGNRAARQGTKIHVAYSRIVNALGYATNVVLRSGRRPDAVDFVNRVVRELKPNNARAIARGLRQARRYARELRRKHGGTWSYIVDVYN
jgi:hypothetical protein